MISIGIDIKKPHFVSEVRNFRHCDRVNYVTCQVLYSLSNDNANILNIYIKYNYMIKIYIYKAVNQCIYFFNQENLIIKQKAKLYAWLHVARVLPYTNVLTLITRFSVRNLCKFLTKGKEQNKDTKKRPSLNPIFINQ